MAQSQLYAYNHWSLLQSQEEWTVHHDLDCTMITCWELSVSLRGAVLSSLLTVRLEEALLSDLTEAQTASKRESPLKVTCHCSNRMGL